MREKNMYHVFFCEEGAKEEACGGGGGRWTTRDLEEGKQRGAE